MMGNITKILMNIELNLFHIYSLNKNQIPVEQEHCTVPVVVQALEVLVDNYLPELVGPVIA